MIVIGANSHSSLALQLSIKLGCDYIMANTQKFLDQELKVQISRDLSREEVIIVQSITKPANDHLMELLLLADTAKRSGAHTITAVIPYFGYSRQDRPSYEYGPISASLVARLIEISGIDRVITVDLHSKQSEGFFKIGVKNLDPSDLFVEVLEKKCSYMVISPDVGGVPRAQVMASKLSASLGIINKARDSHGKCIVTDIIGNVEGKDCIIIDDIVDTGGTLIEASQILVKYGAKSVSACITHGVFSGDCLLKLDKIGFAQFMISDTIEHPNLPAFIQVISVNEQVAKAI